MAGNSRGSGRWGLPCPGVPVSWQETPGARGGGVYLVLECLSHGRELRGLGEVGFTLSWSARLMAGNSGGSGRWGLPCPGVPISWRGTPGAQGSGFYLVLECPSHGWELRGLGEVRFVELQVEDPQQVQ